MHSFLILGGVVSLAALSSATILQNGQERITQFLNTKIEPITLGSAGWTTFAADTKELSYKGRWDDRYISWWAAPGLKFAFDGQDVAITFGKQTSDGVLVAYRVGGLDWQFSNITVGATHQLVSPSTPGVHLATSEQLPLTFELRVSNWPLGVQISNVHLSRGSSLHKIPNHPRKIEFIGDSLTAGYSASYETLSGFGFATAAGFGNVEYSITAYPGICLHDTNCWGNLHGQEYQWFRTIDTSFRGTVLYPGATAPMWDFSADQPADIVIINIGTNDNHPNNNISSSQYHQSYLEFIPKVHATYPSAQIILMSLWNGFAPHGNSYRQTGAFVDEIHDVYKTYSSSSSGSGNGNGNKKPYIHYFNTTGILQHNDINPQHHPTDVGHLKLAYSLIQYINTKFGWDRGATGPEIQHETTYWNDEVSYWTKRESKEVRAGCCLEEGEHREGQGVSWQAGTGWSPAGGWTRRCGGHVFLVVPNEVEYMSS